MEKGSENTAQADDESMIERYLLALKALPATTPALPLGEPKAMLPSMPGSFFNSLGSLPGAPQPFALNYALPPFPFVPLTSQGRTAFDPVPYTAETSLSTPVDSSPTHSTVESPLELPSLPSTAGLYNVYGANSGAPYGAMFPFNSAMMQSGLSLYMPFFPPTPSPSSFSNPLPAPVPMRPDTSPPQPPSPPTTKSTKSGNGDHSATNKMIKDAAKAIIFVQDKDGDGSKPFRCPVEGCQRTYKYKGDLKTHVQNVHSDMPELPDIISPPKKSKEGKRFPCPIDDCPSGFKSKRDLGRHLRHKHPNYTPLEKDFIHYWQKEDEA